LTDLIVNPVSGSGAGSRAAAAVVAEFNKRGVKYAVHETRQAGDAATITAECVKNGSSAVVVIGGDGSVQELAGVMAGTGVPLGVVPAGSGNDLVASLYGYKKKDPAFYIETILAGKTRAVDLIKCRAASEGKMIYFANIASVGLDAEIVDKADDFKKVFGRFAYIASTVYNAFTYKTVEMSYKTENASYGGGLCLVCLCNGGVYGGGFKISPQAKMDDGLITACVVKPMTKLKVLALFPSVLSGKHVRLSEISFTDTSSITVDYSGVKKVNFDGNIMRYKGPLEFVAMPGALTVFG